MQRKRILWLVSWYPNKNDRFNGDFVQRHAKAAAIHNDIHVIFVTEAGFNQPEEEAFNTSTGLTEQIIYYKSNKGLVGRIMKQWKWKKMWVKAIKEYINKNAHPDFIHVHIPWKVGIIA